MSIHPMYVLDGSSTALSATRTDGTGTGTFEINTPSATNDGTLPEPIEIPSAPEPTVLLHEIQQAAEDISQLVGRFGYKMAKTLTIRSIKEALFADRNSLRLPCLQYADNFSCVVTRLYAKPINDTTSAPLLWWLWDELLDYLQPTGLTRGCRLEFTPANKTDMAYIITINLSSKNTKDNIKLSASYGGPFDERRTFDAPITQFNFPVSERYGKPTMAILDIDRNPYEESGCLAHILDYLVPRPGSRWRHAMKDFPPAQEEILVVALAKTCKAEDDRFFMSENQEKQCQNLLRRFPIDAREYVADKGLVGMKGGPYSKTAFQPPGPKD